MRKRKKENKLMEKKIKELSLKNEELEKKLEGRSGYYNQDWLLKSSGLITRDTINNFNIVDGLYYMIKTSIFGLFDYENMPNEIPSQELERLLFEEGKALFFELGGKYYITKYISEGKKDLYNNDIEVRPVFNNGKVGSKRKVNEDCIIIKNNLLGSSTKNIINPFVERASLVFEVSSANLKASMLKWLVITSPDEIQKVKAELQNLFDKNGYFAFVSSDFGDRIKEVRFYEDFDSSIYWEDFNNTLNFIYTLLGVATNPNEDKKERLLVDEININENKTNLILEGLFKSRLEGIKKINKLYDLNINLKMYVNYEEKGVKNYEDETDY